MQATRAPGRMPAVLLLPGGEELPLPVAPADVPASVVNLMLRTVLRHHGGQDGEPDPYDVEHARFLAAGFIALLDRDRPPPTRPRRRRPADQVDPRPGGMATLF